MIVFLDTDVLVDYLRGTSAAKAWMESVSTEPLQIPGLVAMELVIGCRNQRQLHDLKAFLDSLDVVWPEPAEMRQAFELLTTTRLKQGTSIPDAIIAAMAISRGARLCTFNIRHFEGIEALDAASPYVR